MVRPVPALPQGSIVLVTGATGQLGLHIIDKLFEQDYTVRAATSSKEHAAWMKDYFSRRYPNSQLEIFEIADYGEVVALNSILQGVSGVVHVDTKVDLSPDLAEGIPPSVKEIETILKTIASHGSIKRLVLTTSSTVMHSFTSGLQSQLDETEWNKEEAMRVIMGLSRESGRGNIVYSANKAAVEERAWKFMKLEKPGFVLNTVLPDVAFGRLLRQTDSVTTASLLRSAFTGVEEGRVRLEDTAASCLSPQWMVDYEDIARVHVVALLDSEVSSARLMCHAHKFTWTKILDVFKKLYPRRKFVQAPANETGDLATTDTGLVPDLLRKWYGQDGFIPLEETIRKNVEVQ